MRPNGQSAPGVAATNEVIWRQGNLSFVLGIPLPAHDLRTVNFNPRSLAGTLERSSGRHWSRRPLLDTTCRAFPTTGRHDRRPQKDCAVSCLGRQCLHNANASGVSCAPAHGSALLAHAGSGLADTVDHYPAHATTHTGFRNCAVRLMHRRNRHCLRSGSERQPETARAIFLIIVSSCLVENFQLMVVQMNPE